MNPSALLLLSGSVVSCGALLALAGASKAYRGARRMDDDVAIRRALRMTRGRWRATELAVGSLEFATGIVVCTLRYPALSGAVMTVLGTVFCGLLGYVRVKRVPGGCGCIGWRRNASETVTWRAVARAGLLICAGVAEMTILKSGPAGFHRPWFAAGALSGAIILIVLSTDLPLRTPVCRRRLWYPLRSTLRALARHGVFEAMAESAGPFGPDIRYRRTGCADEFWFTTLDGAVVFQVEHAAPGGALAVRASVADAALVAAGGRVRVISRRSALAAERAGADAKLAEILGAGSRRVAGPVTAR